MHHKYHWGSVLWPFKKREMVHDVITSEAQMKIQRADAFSLYCKNGPKYRKIHKKHFFSRSHGVFCMAEGELLVVHCSFWANPTLYPPASTPTPTHSPSRSSTLTATKKRDPSRDTRSQRAGFQHLHSLSTTRWPRMAAWPTIRLQQTHSHTVSLSHQASECGRHFFYYYKTITIFCPGSE